MALNYTDLGSTPDGYPAVMLKGTEIAGSDFLNKPIDQTPSVAIATFAGTEIMENRSYRQIRLKTASAVGESPGLEFLIESWGDVLLRSQIKQLIEKYSFWGIFINEQNQLEQLESAATLQRPSQAEKPCDETADFPLTVNLHHESPEYQKLKFPTADDFTEYVVKVDPQDFTDPSEWSATGDINSGCTVIISLCGSLNVEQSPMGKRITIQPHLSVAELKTRYLKAKDPVERSRYQIVWLMAQGKRTSEVALVTGYSSHWIRTLIRRYNQLGAAGLADRRHNHPGGEPLLDDVQQAQLWQALHGPAPDGGLWNSRKVAEWISERLDRPVAPQRGWDYLQQMGFRLCVPRPQHEEADCLEHAIWKKKLAAMVAQVQKDHPQAVVELWTMDEHRLGLKPVLRRVWVPMGEQPTARVHWRYQWLWVYGFVQPESGENYWWILPKVNIKLFNQVLADFAREFGAGKDKRIILTLDQAGWHTSSQVQVPEGIHLEFMPSHSPELQPAERLWPLTNEPIANESFETLDDLEEVLFHRCQALLKQRELVRGLTCFHWWPRTASS